MLKHDIYLDELCSRIKPEYDSVIKNVHIYGERKRLVAEIDILAIKGNKIDVYEVKCSNKPHKARRQLERIKRLLVNKCDVKSLFFFCGDSGKLEEMIAR